MKILKYICFSFLVSSTFVVQAQQNLSIAQAVERGLKNNFQIQIANLQTEIAENNNNWLAAGRHPVVNFILNSGNNYASTENPASIFRISALENLCFCTRQLILFII